MKNSKKIDQYISIFSCELIPKWDQPLTSFLSELGLTPTSTLPKDITLGQFFSISICDSFPLLKSPKITINTVTKLAREQKIHGLVVISGYCGKESLKQLKDFKIFSSLTPKGKMENSNTIKNSLVSANMLHYLLNNKDRGSLKDFVLTDISEVFLWPKIDIKPYKNICLRITDLLAQNTNNKPYCQVLKNLANMYVGLLAYSPRNHPSTIIMETKDFHDLTQIKNLTSTQAINNDVILANFKSHRSYSNSSHNHFLVVQESRLIFIKMLLSFSHFLDLDYGSCNCDGLLSVSPIPLSTSGRGASKEGVLAIDSCLKSSLSITEVVEYAALKQKYFKVPMVCPSHHSKYIESLINNTTFTPSLCCQDFITENEYPHKLTVRIYGEKAVIFGINKSFMIDMVSQETTVKCSGRQVRDIETIFAKSPADIKQMFLNVASIS